MLCTSVYLGVENNVFQDCFGFFAQKNIFFILRTPNLVFFEAPRKNMLENCTMEILENIKPCFVYT